MLFCKNKYLSNKKLFLEQFLRTSLLIFFKYKNKYRNYKLKINAKEKQPDK